MISLLVGSVGIIMATLTQKDNLRNLNIIYILVTSRYLMKVKVAHFFNLAAILFDFDTIIKAHGPSSASHSSAHKSMVNQSTKNEKGVK